MSLRSWEPGLLFTPPHSLRTRLVVEVLGLVLVMTAVTSTFSTVSPRHTPMARTGSQLMATAQRTADKRHDLTQEARKASDEAIQEDTEDQGDQPGEAAGAGGGPDKSGAPPDLNAAEQSTGTLTLITPRTSSSDGETSETVAYIDKNGRYASISKEDCRLLLSQATEDHPITVSLYHLDSYRVVITRDRVSGSTVITGLSLGGDKGLIRTQLFIELTVALMGAFAVALAGRTMVCSTLAPLERVARTTHCVTSQSLKRDEVSTKDRVEKADLDSSAEAGQVGDTLNMLLGHVKSVLAMRQRLKAQVRQSVANASHELRMPLASVRGYAELTRREGADADLSGEAVHALERVHSESVRMTAFVEDLLLLARLDTGRELHRGEVDLVGPLVDTVTDARVADPDHGWQLDLAILESLADATPEEAEGFLPEPPLAIDDETRLRQAVANLLANTRVYMPASSRVTTMLAREGDTLIVRAHDDGPGIAPDVRDHLFERFVQGDSSRERRTGFTGLGILIALAIVQSHGGSIDVASPTTSENHGIALSVRLPAITVEE